MSMFVLVRRITSNVFSPLQCVCSKTSSIMSIFCSVKFKNDFMMDRLLVRLDVVACSI